MISGLSKAITLYLAPLLALTAILLSLFAYLAPTFLLHDKVALVTVVPSTALIPNSNSSQSLDGPSIFMGVLGMRFMFIHVLPKNSLELTRWIIDLFTIRIMLKKIQFCQY